MTFPFDIDQKMQAMWLVGLMMAALLVLSSCSRDSSLTRTVHTLSNPAGNHSHLPHLYVDQSGTLVMSWVEESGDDPMAYLNYAVRSDDGPWSDPQTISRGDDWFVNWADFPSIVSADGRALAAHWLVKRPGNSYSYDIRIALRENDSWNRTLTPHKDSTRTEHGFVSMIPWKNDTILAIWLDGRRTAGRSEEEYYDLEKAMTLRSAVIDRSGRILESHLIDSTVCDCCQTDLAPTARGAIAVYRNRTDGEIRDIQASRYQEGRWTEPVTVHPDGWKIGGCPVNGPAVASSGDHLLISWFTNSGDTPQVKAVFSNDGGQSFSDPVRIDDGNPLGRVDAALRPEGKSGFVSWMEKTEEGADFRYRQVGSERMESVTVSAMNASRSSGFPRMVLQNRRLLFAWTAIDSLPHVETAYYPLTNGH